MGVVKRREAQKEMLKKSFSCSLTNAGWFKKCENGSSLEP